MFLIDNYFVSWTDVPLAPPESLTSVGVGAQVTEETQTSRDAHASPNSRQIGKSIYVHFCDRILTARFLLSFLSSDTLIASGAVIISGNGDRIDQNENQSSPESNIAPANPEGTGPDISRFPRNRKCCSNGWYFFRLIVTDKERRICRSNVWRSNNHFRFNDLIRNYLKAGRLRIMQNLKNAFFFVKLHSERNSADFTTYKNQLMQRKRFCLKNLNFKAV